MTKLPLKLCSRSTAVIVFSMLAAVSVHAQTLRLRIVDGRNGRPIPNEQPQVTWIGHQNASPVQIQTNTDGIAKLDLPSGKIDYVRIDANLYYDCRKISKDMSPTTYSVREALRAGIVAINTCGKLEIDPGPGEIILFVRPLHRWERLKR